VWGVPALRWTKVAPDRDPLAHRRDMVASLGAYAPDFMQTRWRCPACAAEVTGAPATVMALICYRTLEGAEQLFTEAVRAFVECFADPFLEAFLGQEDVLPTCPACRRPARLASADYHLHHSGLGQDIVLRHVAGRGGAPEVERLRWSADLGFAPLGALDEAASRLVTRDALLRAARGHEDQHESDDLCAVMEEAARTIPDEPELVGFLPALARVGARGLVDGIARTRMRLCPDEPDGYYWAAQMIVDNAAAGEARKAALSEAVVLLEMCLRLAPEHPDAEIALASVARVLGAHDNAESRLRDLVARYPGHPEANYALGQLLLDTAPGDALDCFVTGERSCPGSADYPRGRARALLRLGRNREALAAAVEAHDLAPDDPRVDRVLAHCASLTAVQDGRRSPSEPPPPGRAQLPSARRLSKPAKA
jgi:tetratricopeptide (TPR) repeat protein